MHFIDTLRRFFNEDLNTIIQVLAKIEFSHIIASRGCPLDVYAIYHFIHYDPEGQSKAVATLKFFSFGTAGYF